MSKESEFVETILSMSKKSQKKLLNLIKSRDRINQEIETLYKEASLLKESKGYAEASFQPQGKGKIAPKKSQVKKNE